ncbi:MAG TPA: DUF748 domain-containing protein [Thermodesulfobacteriota bacterium]|nr:DUF748 domain-containing protein [Thermodesulfobacteriota bacterium]
MGGKITPASDNLFGDLSAKFRDLDLRSLTPYSGKYLGSMIEKGKLRPDEPDRIFIIEARSLTPEKKENFKNSKVDFRPTG